MKLGLYGNYDVSVFLNQSPGKKGLWKTLTVEPNAKECDAVLVCNRPDIDIKVSCYARNRWMVIQEPPYDKNKYFESYFKYFDHIISHFNASSKAEMHREPALLPWHIGECYDELKKMDSPQLLNKQDKIAWITSNSNMNPGHVPRLRLLDALQQSSVPCDIYGRGIKPINKKSEALFGVKYALAIENFSDTDYWTEKIADCFLAWCLPVYFGCTNLNKYFPEGSFIFIDINNPIAALETIRAVIENNEWEKRLPLIAQAREYVLEKYNLFPAMEKKLQESIFTGKKKKYYFPAEPWKIKSRIIGSLYSK